MDYHLRFAEDVGLLPPAIRAQFADEVIQVKRMLLALHRTVRERALAARAAEKAAARRASRADR